ARRPWLPAAGTCPRVSVRADAPPPGATRRCGTSRPWATIRPWSPSARPAGSWGCSAAARGADAIPDPPRGASTRDGDRSSAAVRSALRVGDEREDETTDLDVISFDDTRCLEHPEHPFPPEVALELGEFVLIVEIGLEDPTLDAPALHVPRAACIAFDGEPRAAGTEHDVRAPLGFGSGGHARESVHAVPKLIDPSAGEGGDGERVGRQRGSGRRGVLHEARLRPDDDGRPGDG